jgi:hypothetical protein
MVPGVGMMGPDIGGYAKGDMMRQEFALKANADSRAEGALGLEKEGFGLKKDFLKIAQEQLGISKAELGMKAESTGIDNQIKAWDAYSSEKKVTLDQGMQEAAKTGGFTGVVDYLKTADPVLAMNFQAKKLELDDSIMRNDVAKDLLPALKADALVQGYRVMANFSQAVLKAKPEDRESVYSAALPMLRKVNPDMPDNLQEGASQLMIAVAAGTPASQLMENVNKEGSLSGELGNAIQTQSYLKKNGIGEDDPRMIAANATIASAPAKLEAIRNKKQSTELAQARMQQQTRNSIYTNSEKLQNDLDKDSKPFVDWNNKMSMVQGALNTLDKDPTNSAAQGTLGTILASGVQVGALREEDYTRIAKSNTYFKHLLENKIPEMKTGKIVNLSPSEVQNLRQLVTETNSAVETTQMSREKQYKSKIDIYGKPTEDGAPAVVDPDAIQMPSQTFSGMKLVNKFGFQDEDPPTQALIGKWLNAGKDPEAIKKLIAEKRGAK